MNKEIWMDAVQWCLHVAACNLKNIYPTGPYHLKCSVHEFNLIQILCTLHTLGMARYTYQYRSVPFKRKWSSLSHWSGDFVVSRARACHYVVIWNATCQLMIMRKLHRSCRQVHFKRLHNDTHVPCSLQRPHSNGTGMITSIRNLSENRTVPIRVPSHP